MKKSKSILVLVMAAFFTLTMVPNVMAADLVDVPTCWMPEHETFLMWYAIQKGWDKEEGLNLGGEKQFLYFDSGMAQMEALPARQWVLGATGGVPQVMGTLRYGAYVIGQGNNESWCNSVYVRPDSPIMGVKGWNKDYPEVYGSPDLIKGKTILVTTVSSVHYAMSSWLKVFGLKDSDVVIKQMDQASIMAAFEKGVGDIAAIWCPYSYKADEKGWKVAGNIDTCGAALTITLIGDKKFCDENPEIVAKFLRIYLRAVNMMQAEGSSPEIVKEYQKFFQEWAGMEYTAEQAKQDIDFHPVWNLEEQLKLFDGSQGPSQSAIWQKKIAEFFAAQGKYTEDDLKKLEEMNYGVTDKFLKLVETPIPGYK
jgi:ABC-type nitrate/sulfonate/bicarbonate transport system substrate-binding protein